MAGKILTQERLRQKLIYFPETGLFIWKDLFDKYGFEKIAGTLHESGYQKIQVDRKIYRAHRLAWLYTFGEFPLQDIDHINRIRSDNRIENLRCVSRSENMLNLDPASSVNKSGFRGLKKTKNNSWSVRVMVDGKTKYIGTFKDAKQASEAYLSAKEKK